MFRNINNPILVKYGVLILVSWQ